MPMTADRVRETTTTAGTGNLALAGALAGFRAFQDAFPVGSTVWYALVDGTAWEVGQGTLVSAAVLSRDVVLSSSNAGGLVALSGSTVDVFNTAPSALTQAAGRGRAAAAAAGMNLT